MELIPVFFCIFALLTNKKSELNSNFTIVFHENKQVLSYERHRLMRKINSI
ncbi:hypothetical protein BAT_2896 [Bacillus pumilus ATCC 7061]|nr:hypothetical protein BAT_2896 [Bacillus pumilus ATCC 7061]